MATRDWTALLVHGAGGGAWEWDAWRRVFEASGVRVRALDLQPCARGLAATTFADYAVQVEEAFALLPHPRALVGASLGGLLAAACAGRADALVLVNPVPPAPLHARLPPADLPDVVAWRETATLSSTRRSMPDADEATALFAFRRWRDDSGRALRDAWNGIDVAAPACPVLCIVSEGDEDVPPATSVALAEAWGASLLRVPGSHVGPLLGRRSARIAADVMGWLSER